jgi:HSP20 family protein
MRNLLGSMAGFTAAAAFPAINLWADEEKAVVTAEIPGVKTEDIDISVENDILTIKGRREPEELKDGERYRRQERRYGNFNRAIGLPFAVDPEKISAEYKDGVLKITLPRHEASKPRKIEIEG